MRERLALAVLAASLPVAAGAQVPEEAGDPGRGRALAVERCGGCHHVGPDLPTPPPAPEGASAPSFMAMADRADASPDRLLALLQTTPHPPMPSPPLDRQQWRDVVAYMLTFGLFKPSQ